MTSITDDHWIHTEFGTLFARTWRPSNPLGESRATILLFHDSLGCVDLWRDFPQQLAISTGLPITAYDRLGFGLSDPHPGSLPVTFIRDEATTVVPSLVKKLGFETMVAMGHSVGGAMAIATAACFPERCAAVVTESAQSFIEDRTLTGLETAQVDFARPTQFERLTRYHGAKARWVLDSWIDTWLSPAFSGWSLDDLLRNVTCPLLALHGDRDEYGSLQHQERIAHLSRGPSRAVTVNNCGHVPHREHPERVLAEITRFLTDYPANKFCMWQTERKIRRIEKPPLK
jgi:pimeloyl-ACP methyl ester carboxylesterase